MEPQTHEWELKHRGNRRRGTPLGDARASLPRKGPARSTVRNMPFVAELKVYPRYIT